MQELRVEITNGVCKPIYRGLHGVGPVRRHSLQELRTCAGEYTRTTQTSEQESKPHNICRQKTSRATCVPTPTCTSWPYLQKFTGRCCKTFARAPANTQAPEEQASTRANHTTYADKRHHVLLACTRVLELADLLAEARRDMLQELCTCVGEYTRTKQRSEHEGKPHNICRQKTSCATCVHTPTWVSWPACRSSPGHVARTLHVCRRIHTH